MESQQISGTGLHHVRMPVSDLVVSRAFWEDTLGYHWEFDFPGEDGPSAVALRHAGGWPNLVLWLAPGLRDAASGFTLFGLGVPTLEDLIEVRTRLDAAGVSHGGIQTAFIVAKLPAVRTPAGGTVGFYVKPLPPAVCP